MIRQIIKALTLLVAVSIVAFALVSLSPIDPVQANVGTTAYLRMTPEKKAQLASYWGKDISPVERYLNWAGDFVRGDMGISLKYNRPVAEVVLEKFRNSLLLMCVAWVLSGVFGFVLGMIAGYYRDRWPDKVIRGYALLLASTPAFWIALFLLMVFAVWLGWLPFGMNVPIGMTAAEVGFAEKLRHLILPALTLSLTGVANITLHTREKMIDILESDYVLFARARGDADWKIVREHVLRNILLPAITLQFGSVSEIFGGSVLVEQVFSYPGLGQAAVDAGLGGDVALLLAITVISTLLVFAGNLTANLLYGMIDPQIRRGRSHG
ncbi:MAG: ABC transporter permease [Roseburia sp.]